MSRNQSQRLPSGGLIDRARPLDFTFNGRPFEAYAGDCLASALLAAGVTALGSSPRLGRPRGLLTADRTEPAPWLTLSNAATEAGTHAVGGSGRRLGLAAPLIELYDGLALEWPGGWPAGGSGSEGSVGRLGRLLTAGPEPESVSAQDVAALDPSAPSPVFDTRHIHGEVVIIGAGPAGLAAAQAAARAGVRVVIVDDQVEPGGHLLGERARLDGRPALDWVEAVAAELMRLPAVTFLTRTTAIDLCRLAPSGRAEATQRGGQVELLALERLAQHHEPTAGEPWQRLWRIRAPRLILATGSLERPLVFPDNDRPGIMLAQAVRHYLNRYAVLAGKRAVVMTNNDEAYRTALDLQRAGAEVPAVLDLRGAAEGLWARQAREAGIDILPGLGIAGVEGRGHIEAVMTASIAPDGRLAAGGRRRIDCDLLCVSGGFLPATALMQRLQALEGGGGSTAPIPAGLPLGMVLVGGAAGRQGLATMIAGAVEAGIQAAGAEGGIAKPMLILPRGEPREEAAFDPVIAQEGSGGDLPWILRPAEEEEGTAPARVHAERSWLDGAGEQSLAAAQTVLSRFIPTDGAGEAWERALVPPEDASPKAVAAGSPPEATVDQEGGASARMTAALVPPSLPVAARLGLSGGARLGALAAGAVSPLALRETPLVQVLAAEGAVWRLEGGWRCADHFSLPQETREDGFRREIAAALEGCCLSDGTPQGRLDIQGPGAARLLDALFSQPVSPLKPGMALPRLLLAEEGRQGRAPALVLRLAERQFQLILPPGQEGSVTSRLNAAAAKSRPGQGCFVTDLTEGEATLLLIGPQAPELLQRLTTASAPAGVTAAKAAATVSGSEAEVETTDGSLSPAEGDAPTPAQAPAQAQAQAPASAQAPAPAQAQAPASALPAPGHWRRLLLAEQPVRLVRLDWSGLPVFELSLPANHAQSLWQHLRAGAEGLMPHLLGAYGLEALRAARGLGRPGLEMTAGLGPRDLGWPAAEDESAAAAATVTTTAAVASKPPANPQLVALTAEGATPSEAPDALARLGCPVLDGKGKTLGWVTGTWPASRLGPAFALALVLGGRQGIGQAVRLAGDPRPWLIKALPLPWPTAV